MKPKRIQRKRTRGWKMPPNTVSVTRPGKWGNPFPIIDGDVTHSLDLFQDMVNNNLDYQREVKLELEGKNLACFCRLDQPCHADILLELANK